MYPSFNLCYNPRMLVLLSLLFAKEETVYEEAKTYVQQDRFVVAKGRHGRGGREGWTGYLGLADSNYYI